MSETITYKQIDKICEIKVVDKRPSTDYKYYPLYEESRGWLRKPIIHNDVYVSIYGGMDGCYEEIYKKEDILKYTIYDNSSTYIIEDNIVYYRPFVHIKFDSKHINGHTKYFYSFDEAKNWASEFILKNGLDSKLIKF
jgi:hypothetical protein